MNILVSLSHFILSLVCSFLLLGSVTGATSIHRSVPAFCVVDSQIDRHASVALTRAEKYYRYEHRVGSNSISVVSSDVSLEDTVDVPGWEIRFRTTGKASLEIFDSRGRSYSRVTFRFEVFTEQNGSGRIVVVDFLNKS